MCEHITAAMVKALLPARPSDGHKGTFGRVLLIVGQYGMAGAAILSARAALRSGVGLVTVALPKSIYPIVAGAVPEAVFLPLDETADGHIAPSAAACVAARAQQADAVVLGCGLGCDATVTALADTLMRQLHCPLILDADGINAIQPHMLLEETVTASLILTPHTGEMARLIGGTAAAVQADRAGLAQRFADAYGVTLVLKGHRTLVAAPQQPLRCNETGNDGMATGGSGDVLAGLVGGLAAQGMTARDAAVCGVYLHGAAGDRAAARLSRHSMLPSDMLNELGGLFLQFE